jgi:hypothetical protein
VTEYAPFNILEATLAHVDKLDVQG